MALQEQLQQIDTQLATDTSRYTNGHPAIADLLEKRQYTDLNRKLEIANQSRVIGG